jgi:hypothetical protein
MGVKMAQPIDLGWCPFCGERFKPKAKTKEAFFEGKIYRIHRDEYREFAERGMLRYLDSPRSGWLSQDTMDLILIAGTGIVAFVFLMIALRLLRA